MEYIPRMAEKRPITTDQTSSLEKKSFNSLKAEVSNIVDMIFFTKNFKVE